MGCNNLSQQVTGTTPVCATLDACGSNGACSSCPTTTSGLGGALCGIIVGTNAFPTTFTLDYCSQANQNLLVAAGGWTLTEVTGAAFDSWTLFLASAKGCVTKLTANAYSTKGTAQVLINELTQYFW